MDNQRLMIWAFLGLMGWITYQTWIQDYAVKPAPQVQSELVQSEQLTPPANETLPELSASSSTLDAPNVNQANPEQTPKTNVAVIRVSTDVLDVHISLQGGTLETAILKSYPVAKDQPDTLITLLSTEAENFGAIQTGLRIAGDGAEPNHLATFTSASNRYDMGDAEELIVPINWQDDTGVTLEKRFRFTRGHYAIEIEQELTNETDKLWRGAEYAQIQRILKEQERSMFDVDSYSFSGPIIYDGEKSQKLKLDDLLEDGAYKFKAQSGWLGAIQHHFLSAIVPRSTNEQSYSISARDDRSTASAIGAVEIIAPGSSKTFSTTAFIGPKLQSQLDEIHEKLNLTVDYGWLTLISHPLFLLLSFVFGFVKNWGVAIILVTFLIKLAFYKLTESSGRSMAKMRNLQPRMKALQERYKDDKPALSTAMMELYKREKVNPAAGCLPILIQMPFFLAFYWVLLESVEMRQAPFALWITDLSTKDPFFILPLIMGAAMFMQQKLNPAPADPIQAKVMQIMPIMFTAFFAFFPSGLVLYWVTNTLLSIAQQWKINNVVEQEAKAKKSRA